MCKIITSGWCPYADDYEEVKTCNDCPWYEPDKEEEYFEDIKGDEY